MKGQKNLLIQELIIKCGNDTLAIFKNVGLKSDNKNDTNQL